MRYPGPPCQHEGQHCWQDPVGKRHYRLRINHLKALVKYTEQGGIIDTHNDIPNNVREQLYAKERQRISKQSKSPNNVTTGSMLPQINIHVLPTQSPQPLISSSWSSDATTGTIPADSIDISGLLEVAVEEYTNWNLSRVGTESFKENIKKARDVALSKCLDLKQIRRKNPDFFVKQGVKLASHAGLLTTLASGSRIVSKAKRARTVSINVNQDTTVTT